MELSFCNFRQKSIINVVDGKDLGRAQDILFSEEGKIRGFIVPGVTSTFFGLGKAETIFVPWKKICKIGDDVILVELGNSCEFESKSHDID